MVLFDGSPRFGPLEPIDLALLTVLALLVGGSKGHNAWPRRLLRAEAVSPGRRGCRPVRSQLLRSGPAFCDGVASGVEVARSSLYYVLTHCLRSPQSLLGLV